MRKLAIASALALGAFAADAQAIQIYLSSSNALTGANTDQSTTVPTLTLGGANPTTGVLYVWARLAVGSGDSVTGLGLSLNASNAAATTTTSYEIYNPATLIGQVRWNTPVSSGTLGDSFLNSNAVAVSGNPTPTGLSSNATFAGFDPQYNATTNSFLIGAVTFKADAAGTTNLNFAVGQALISGANTTAITFGSALDVQAVNGNIAGATSTLPDGIVVVVPEPTSLGLLSLGGLAAIRRRRA